MYRQNYVFSSSHVWMQDLNHKEGWMPKYWCFWIVVLRALETPLDFKKINPVNPKVNQSWIFIGKTDSEAEVPLRWPPDVKNWLISKDSDADEDWRWKKGMTEDEMVGWHHWLNGHEFEESLGDGDGQGRLECSVHGMAKSQKWLKDLTTTFKNVLA